MTADKENKDVIQILQKAGLSKTPQRIAILNILMNAVEPINISSLKHALKAQLKIDRVTLYRTLSLFKKHMIIREIATLNGVNYLELATSEHPVHPHFICRNCAKLSCLAPLTFSQASPLLKTGKDYSIENIEINISGLCAGCQNATMLQKRTKNNEIDSSRQ